MTIKVLVNGAMGKMGQVTVRTLSAQTDFSVVGQLGRGNNLAEEIKKTKPDIVIDFTNADSVFQNTKTIIEANTHAIIGSSGLLPEQIQELQSLSQKLKLGGIIAPNFSIGAVLMMKYASDAAKYFPDVEIIEMHHPGKLDSPSGTSIRTAEIIANSRRTAPKILKTKEVVAGARGANYREIPVHAVRLPGLVAHQQVIFGNLGETLTLKHDSIDRECFMPGVVLACKKVSELKNLVYGLENIL